LGRRNKGERRPTGKGPGKIRRGNPARGGEGKMYFWEKLRAVGKKKIPGMSLKKKSDGQKDRKKQLE